MMKNSLVSAFAGVILLTACGTKAPVSNEAPTIMCESHYEAPAGTGFNLLDWISISRGSSKTKTHLSMRGAVDNAVPGDYNVMLTAYDEDGNISIRNLSVTITEPLPEQEVSEETVEELDEPVEPAPESSAEPEATPEPTPKVSATPAPTAASNPAPATVQTDPYAQAKADCAATYGTWTEGGCVWPTPVPAQAAPAAPAAPNGMGDGNCWQDGAYTVCEWVMEWEEYE